MKGKVIQGIFKKRKLFLNALEQLQQYPYLDPIFKIGTKDQKIDSNRDLKETPTFPRPATSPQGSPNHR